jgi:hypothetical protein
MAFLVNVWRVEAEYMSAGSNNILSLTDNKPFHMLVNFQG